ncbi:MAG: hypothetical protein KIT13_01155 [Burkholderiales bacterium]|nr:hypothetical protein [Burkholderiales bacterium]MCW5604760.1 hypothetical protein [Burkholderiales bacterium]
MRAMLAILLMAVLPAAHAAELAGRLFFTPEQRAQLDQLRRQKMVASQVSEQPLPETVSYNGIIRRSDGKTTIWMNNQPMSAAELRSGQSVTGTVSRDGRIVLQNPQSGSGARLELKVGQSATLLSGKVDESFSSQRAPASAKNKPTDTKAATETPKLPQAADGGPERPAGRTPEPGSR